MLKYFQKNRNFYFNRLCECDTQETKGDNCFERSSLLVRIMNWTVDNYSMLTDNTLLQSFEVCLENELIKAPFHDCDERQIFLKCEENIKEQIQTFNEEIKTLRSLEESYWNSSKN